MCHIPVPFSLYIRIISDFFFENARGDPRHYSQARDEKSASRLNAHKALVTKKIITR